MKTIYVETKKVVSHDMDGEAVYETGVQKLQEFGAFDIFCKLYKSTGYRSAKVVGVFDRPKGKEGVLLKDAESLLPYNKMLEKAKQEIKDVSTNDLKSELEKERAFRIALEKKVEALIDAKEQTEDEDDEKEALNARYKELTGKGAGRMSKETLIEKIQELEKAL